MTEQLKNTGHGHVTPRADGFKARCGGPAFCRVCQQEQAVLTTSQPAQAGEGDETAAFEAWVAKGGRSHQLRLDDHGMYEDLTVVAWWTAWQARASLPTQPAAQATPEPVQPFLVRDVAALLGASVPDVCKELVHLGHGQRSTNMEIKPEEALAVAEHIRAKAATPEPVDWKPIKTSAGGREAVRSFFRSTLKRHDFDDYITGALAADFACVLGGYLQATATPTQQAAGEPVGEPFKVEQCMQVASDEFDAFLIGGCKGEPPRMSMAFASTLFKTIIRDRGMFFPATRPAPGVPEGWSTHTDAHGSGKYWLRDAKGTLIARDMSKATAETLASVLAAAQAKGGEHARYERVGDSRTNLDGSISTLVDNGDGTIGTHTTGLPKVGPLVIDHETGAIQSEGGGK